MAGARRMTVLTGAGVSAESGIPTFRDKGGIWDQFDPSEVATLEAFERDPRFVWEWYGLRMKAFQSARPNPAHEALVRMEQRTPEFALITQNIDDLHRVAGSRNIIELHGNIWWTRCLKCRDHRRLEAIPGVLPPRCGRCKGLLRPDVVWFGESLDLENVRRARAACRTDVFLIVGTSGEVWPAAGFAETAQSLGAFLIEVNTQETPLSEIVDLSLFGKAGEVLGSMVPPSDHE